MHAETFDYKKHADMVRKWGETHQFPLPPYDMLPSTGFMVEDKACGFLYTTNSKIGWLEWVFSNPEKTKEERKEALDLLFKLIEYTARDLQVGVLLTASHVPAYADIVSRNGFQETDKNITHFIKILGGT